MHACIHTFIHIYTKYTYTHNHIHPKFTHTQCAQTERETESINTQSTHTQRKYTHTQTIHKINTKCIQNEHKLHPHIQSTNIQSQCTAKVHIDTHNTHT